MENKESILNEETSVEVKDEHTCPHISEELLEHLKEVFDTRKMLSYSVELEYLKGVQQVLNYLEYNYKEQ